MKVHGEIGIVPVPQHAHALESGLLPLDLAGGVVAAGAAEFGIADLLPGLAQLLLDIVFDRQAMTVPARHVGRVEAGHLPGLDDDVLEGLVDRMAEVEIAIGVGRAIVQYEARAAFVFPADGPVQVKFLPFPQARGLAIRKIRPHGEIRVREIQCFLVLAHDLIFGGFPDSLHRKKLFYPLHVDSDLSFQFIQRSELFLVADFLSEYDFNRFSVQISFEIENVCFQHRLSASLTVGR